MDDDFLIMSNPLQLLITSQAEVIYIPVSHDRLMQAGWNGTSEKGILRGELVKKGSFTFINP